MTNDEIQKEIEHHRMAIVELNNQLSLPCPVCDGEAVRSENANLVKCGNDECMCSLHWHSPEQWRMRPVMLGGLV